MAREVHVFAGFMTWRVANFAAQRAIAEGRVASSTLGLLMSEATLARLGLDSPHRDFEAGATLSGMSGGVLGSIAKGLTAVPMVSVRGFQLLAAGPISAALIGSSSGAQDTGMIGVFSRLGMTESQIRSYGELLDSNGLILSVSTSDADTRNRCVSALSVRIDESAITTATHSSQDKHWPSRLSTAWN